jgi:hypothetical protein
MEPWRFIIPCRMPFKLIYSWLHFDALKLWRYRASMRFCNKFSVTMLAVGNMKCEMSVCSSVMGLTLAKTATDERYWKLLYSVCFVFKCICNCITLTDCQFYCFSAFYPTKWVLCCLHCCHFMMSLTDKIYYLPLLCFCSCINFLSLSQAIGYLAKKYPR